MRATLEFNLPDDNTEYELARLGERSHLVLWELWNYFQRVSRGKITDNVLTEGEADYVRDMILETMEDRNVPLEI